MCQKFLLHLLTQMPRLMRIASKDERNVPKASAPVWFFSYMGQDLSVLGVIITLLMARGLR